jgi:hypothetical protein
MVLLFIEPAIDVSVLITSVFIGGTSAHCESDSGEIIWSWRHISDPETESPKD